MLGKIALEEHFAINETVSDSNGLLPDKIWNELRERVLDIHGRRIREMDGAGIETSILSLNNPAVQAIPNRKRAIEIAKMSNEYLAEQIVKRPDRFAGFAALPLQDPDAAILELRRCVKDFGFKGILVNGFTQGEEDPDLPLYYDLPQFLPFWAEVEKLGVPLYLHPRRALPQDRRIYEGYRWMTTAAWGYGHETATHALRLMSSGLFDKFPGLTIILGHLGEGLPFTIWRAESCCSWSREKHEASRGYFAERKLSEYFAKNFYITTSGDFHTQALITAILELGADRILFSTDWPFENMDHAANWFDHASISENDRIKIGRTNAANLFDLK